MPKITKAADAYHHGDLRQALLAAAMTVVDSQGADAVSLAALARTLGVSQAAPYRHFADRDALLVAVAAEGFRAFSAALSQAQAAGPADEALSRMCHAYVAFGLQRPGLYRLMFASPVLASASVSDDLKAVAGGSFAQLVAAVGAQADPERRALKIWVGLHGVVMLASQNLLGGPTTAPTDLTQLVEDILA